MFQLVEQSGPESFTGNMGFTPAAKAARRRARHCYCAITPAHLEFISDTTPIKQGRLSPGAFVAADGSWIVYPPELAIVS